MNNAFIIGFVETLEKAGCSASQIESLTDSMTTHPAGKELLNRLGKEATETSKEEIDLFNEMVEQEKIALEMEELSLKLKKWK